MSNKENILEVALKLFSERGYDSVGVQEIVEKAGITKPTLYHYFENKRGLLDAIIKEYSTQRLVRIGKAAIYSGDVTMTLRNTVAACFNFARSNPEYYRLQMSLWFAPLDSESFQAIKPFIELEQRLFEDIFINAANDHGNMKGRHRVYAASFLGIINTYIGIVANGYAKFDNQLIQQMVHQFMHGIFS